MRLSILSALVLSADTTLAYLNTSPFFLYSTSSRFESRSTTQIDKSSKVYSDISSILETCPTKYYVIVSQAGVSTSDYRDSSNTPNLASNLRSSTDPNIKSSMIVSEVLGDLKIYEWARTLNIKCNTQHIRIEAGQVIPQEQRPMIFDITLPELTKDSSRAAQLKSNDAYLAGLLKHLPAKDYTILYTTTPADLDSSVFGVDESETQYEMQDPFFDIPHAELKRDLSYHKRQPNGNQTLVDGPLFDRYQFFTPGIWMGFSATLLLLGILYVGVNAIASLQVTYAAFEKESGPQSSKKAQ